METARRLSSLSVANLDSRFRIVVLACLVALVCYQTDRLAYGLGILPTHISLFWPATPFLVAVLLLTRKRIWPVLLAAGLGAIVLSDFKSGMPARLEIWMVLGDMAEIFVAVAGINRLFKGVPQLNSVRNLAKYSLVAVILAPLVSASIGAIARAQGDYGLTWRLWFFSDALAFLTVTPAILSWVREGRAWARKSRNYVELAALLTSLVLFGYLAFMGARRTDSPALLYLLVPLLLWATLRLGLKGVSTSMLVIAFLAIWGASRDRGPFTGQGPLNNALSLQLFLFFAAMPFMALAAFVEERRRTRQNLTEEHAQMTEAQRLAQVGSWHWDPSTDTVTWSEELYRIAGRDPHLRAPTYKEHGQLYTPESWDRLQRAVEESLRTGQPYELDLEMVRLDGTTKWITARGEAEGDDTGRVVSLRGTVKDITERRRIEEALRESEQRFRLVANTAPVLIWMSGPDKLCNYFNQSWLEFTGRPPEAELGDGWAEGVHPEDLEQCLDTYTRAFDKHESFQMEYRLRRHDGEYRWILDSGVPRFTADGSFSGYIGSGIDVTERKLAEEAISKVNQKLIEAHEEERTRIARELHDDINQRLAILAISLEKLQHNLPSSKAEIRKDIAEAGKQVRDLGSDVQALSHHLHSSKLEYLGLATAAAGFCREASSRQGVEIDFHSENIPKDLPKEASLCLFRVLQEAIQNAAKHSGSRHFEVSLSGGLSEIELRVHDSGIGFDPQEAMKGNGLGLTSISERLKLVNGNLFIDSQPQYGTTIQARVPLTTRMKSAGAAG